MATTAEALAAALKAWGVERVFGVPGGTVLPVIEALGQEGIEFVLVKHENNGALMASAHAQLTGRPGVCLATGGPGTVNFINGLAHAHMDRAPVLAITGQFSESTVPLITHQRLDQRELLAPVVKWSARVDGENVQGVVDKALRIAASDRPGPVHLDIAGDAAGKAAKGGFRYGPVKSPAGPADRGECQRALELLQGAKRPVILAGLGVLWERAHDVLLEVVEKLQCPVMVTPKAKGVIPADHPQFAGVLGLGMAADSLLLEVLRQGDLIVTVGYDPVEVVGSWYRPWSVPTIHIDSLPNIEGFYQAEVELVGSIPASLQALLPEIAPSPEDWQGRAAILRRELREHFGESIPAALRGASPYQLIQALSQALPRETLVTCDVGAHKILACQVWPTFAPGAFLVSNGLSTMGFSLPAAIAARLHDPERPLLCLTGDGGLGMVLGELETAARLGLGFPIILFVDGSLSLIKVKQEEKGYPTVGVDFSTPDWAGIAKSFGARGVKTDSIDTCLKETLAAMEEGRLTLIAVEIDPREYRRQM
ncbi:MAG: thiamine pyrophosphate-binding protein [Firmicutes bacterium]|nr:thiamine pyrophosphate-binding protein [Bacillota bacterium]